MNPDPVITALEEQVSCYQRLAKLAELQHEHVQQGQTEALLEVLSKRQDVLNSVARLEATIAPVKREWQDYIARLPADRRGKAEVLMTETRRLLERITASDRDDTMILQHRKMNLGRQINQATSARQVNKNYAASAYGKRPSQMDVRQ